MSAWSRGAVARARPRWRRVVGDDAPRRPRSRGPSSRSADARARGVLADAGRRAVAGGDHERALAPAASVTRFSACRFDPTRPATRVAGSRPGRGAPSRRARRGRTQVAALAAGLRDEPDAPDLDAALDALDHVVDRQRRHGRGGHRLHLDAGLAGRRRLGADAQDAGGAVGGDRHDDVGQRQRVAQRDELARPLGAHDAGQLGDAQDVALGAAAVDDEAHRLGRHRDGASATARRAVTGLCRDVDHPRPPGPIDVRQPPPLGSRGGLDSVGSRRVASSDGRSGVRPGRATRARPRRRPAARRRPRG